MLILKRKEIYGLDFASFIYILLIFVIKSCFNFPLTSPLLLFTYQSLFCSSEFEELEAVPTLSLMEGPLEPSSSSVPTVADVPDDSFVNFFSVSKVPTLTCNLKLPIILRWYIGANPICAFLLSHYLMWSDSKQFICDVWIIYMLRVLCILLILVLMLDKKN